MALGSPEETKFFCKSYLLEFWVCPAADPLVDVVDVGAGGAGEAEAVGALLDLKDVGARGAEHQHDACRDMWLLLLRIFMRKRRCGLLTCSAAPNFEIKPNCLQSEALNLLPGFTLPIKPYLMIPTIIPLYILYEKVLHILL